MIIIRPFQALRPKPEIVKEVASLPYDVLNSDEAREMCKHNPNSFLHIIKPEIDLDPETDPHDKRVYETGLKNLNAFLKNQILIKESKPCLYVYKLRMDEHVQLGLVAVVSTHNYHQSQIKKHEHTRLDKEKDRIKHIQTLQAQTGPVFLMHKQNHLIAELVEKALTQEPLYDFSANYDIQHTVYKIDDDFLIQDIQKAFSKLDALYVADGHHRSAAAAKVQEIMSKNNPVHTGEEAYNYYLSVIFPENQLNIWDYNRVVKDLNGLSQEAFITKVKDKFNVTLLKDVSLYKPSSKHSFGMYLNNTWYELNVKEGSYDQKSLISSLDVSILQENLLAPILGIGDPRTDQRIHFIGGIRGIKELEKLVDSKEYEIAFSMFPMTIEELIAIADAELVMPPKSTWFEPKLLSGLFTHKF